jgi:hypothetical protein
LSAELQLAHDTTRQSVVTAIDDATDIPKVAKRARIAAVLKPVVQSITSTVPTRIPKQQCQGCVHGDLLETKVMEPAHIKHYLKKTEFLEWARCAGKCANTIKSIHLASPKTNLRYCDKAHKGFNAPDDDVEKADLECGLILCAPCYAVREEQYAQETTKDGGVGRRNRRRGA